MSSSFGWMRMLLASLPNEVPFTAVLEVDCEALLVEVGVVGVGVVCVGPGVE